MNNYDKIKSTAEKAEKIIAGLKCDYAEVRLAEGSGVSIQLSGKETDSLSTGDSTGGSVRILKGGAWGFTTFNGLDDIEKRIRGAAEISSALRIKEKSRVSPSKQFRSVFTDKCERPAATVSIEEKFDLVKSYNAILMSHEKIQTTRSAYRDSSSCYIFINSEGSRLEWNRSFCGVAFSSVAKDGDKIQPYGDSIAGFGGFELALGLEEAAEKTVRVAVDILSAEEIDGGKYDVIADQKLAGVFIHEAFGHLSEADFVYENPRMREIMTLGREFGPTGLNVYDDGSMAGLAGWIPFDDEGVAPQKTGLIINGLLAGRLHSRETSAKMNEPLTGNGRSIGVSRQPIVRMTNTFIAAGDSTKEDIFNAVENGLYAVDYIGGQTNLEMFTFSPACAYLIKNGKPGPLVRNTVLSGNVFATLKNISMIADDLRHFGGLGGCGKGGQSPLPVTLGGPHILIKDVLVGGR